MNNCIYCTHGRRTRELGRILTPPKSGGGGCILGNPPPLNGAKCENNVDEFHEKKLILKLLQMKSAFFYI